MVTGRPVCVEMKEANGSPRRPLHTWARMGQLYMRERKKADLRGWSLQLVEVILERLSSVGQEQLS